MISIITPVLNEEDTIGTLLENLNNSKGDFELIIVDGGSTDRTLDAIDRHKSTFKHNLVVLKSSRGRAVQMNKGAEFANGDILLFLHADTVIENESLMEIEKTIKTGKYIGGGFDHRFSGDNDYIKALSILGNIRVQMTKIFYGDYGIFIRKDIFHKIGGYDEINILEDVEFCKKAKRFGKIVQIKSKLVTSPRRFESIGKLRLTTMFFIALGFNIFGKRPEFLIKYITDK